MTPRRRGRIVAGVLLIVFGGGLLVLALVAILQSDDNAKPLPRSLRAALDDATRSPAHAPFAGLTQARIALARRCLLVVVADSERERSVGLMNRTDLGDYAGMLFVVPTETSNPFTMAGTQVPLDIAWFRADGTRTGSAQMVPCRAAVSNCPLYRPPGEWRFALETRRGELPAGNLAACTA